LGRIWAARLVRRCYIEPSNRGRNLDAAAAGEPNVAPARMVVRVDALPPDDESPPPLDADAALEADVLPVAGPGATRRRLRVAITFVLVASLVVVFGLNLSGGRVRVDSPTGKTLPTTGRAAPPRLVVVDANGALSSMNAEGGEAVRYPGPGLAFQFPAWSPDGTRIASIGTGGGETSLEVFAPPVGGSPAAAPTVVYKSREHPAFYLYWAPDGKALAFLTNEADGIALRHVPADASGPDTTVRTGAPMYWQWVDPTRLLVHSGGNAANGFAGEVGLDGTPAATTAVEAGSFRAPALSGDGSYLAYATSGQEGSPKVVVESRDGAVHRELRVFGVAAFEFGPNGDTLAFTAADNPGGSLDFPVGPLRAIDPASGTVRTLLDGSVVSFFWAPDGRTIAALRVNGPSDTNVASAAAPGATLARAGARAVQAAAGVDLQIAFVDVASGAIRSQRVGRLSDLFVSQVLPYFDQYALSHRFWAPDSSSIVLPIDDDRGVSQIEIIPADGSDAKVVTSGLIASWSP
jgi:TolB protein